MKITIDIESPPDGYGTPIRGPIYLPIGDEIVLIGKHWAKASDVIQYGGSYWIYAKKQLSNHSKGN